MGHFGPHNSGSALKMSWEFWRMKGVNKYMKILLIVFQEEKIGLGQIEPGHY